MSTYRHTPGPWCQVGDVILGATEVGSPCIAECVELEADARLIAAAPELLDALKALTNRGWQDDPPSASELEAANAAIAKAEGK